jgi:glycosyltransferase involved in cell wall biosynthesis
LPGFSDDISSCLHALDVFVMSSLSEGHPLALLEAMAADLPVVATAVGGIPEIITSKKEGLLIAAKDTAELITAIDTQLNASSQEKIENAKALQLKVKELYSINKMVDKTAGYYAKILQSEVSG